MWWIWIAVVIFVIASAARALKYARAPEHLRWDLYPVAHEPKAQREHGGSYLEEKDWWTKPRKTSLWGEASFMMAEIFFLMGVREHNRKLWWFSMPFHWGLYLLGGVTVGLVVTGLGFRPPWLVALLAAVGAVAGVLTAVGALGLLIIRSTDPKMSFYTTGADRLNLLLLVVIGGLCAAVAIVPPGMVGVVNAVGNVLRIQPVEASTLLAVQMTLSALFLLYMPFTRMVHFFSKYFTYHQVRWDDRPVEQGTELEKRLRRALDFGVAWDAEHIKTGKTWAEVATNIPEPKKKGA
jgi:nitrate reductase gamma subunit